MMEKKDVKDLVTIKEAKQYLRENYRGEDCFCPCCTQRVKLYRRHVYDAMIVGLIALYKLSKGNQNWVHMPTVIREKKLKNTGGDFAKLKFWGLTEEKPNEKDSRKKQSGYWRITQAGIDFVENRTKIKKYLFVFDDKLYNVPRKPEEMVEVDIIQALGEDFNYSELMSN
jgi:hypothetical protein